MNSLWNLWLKASIVKAFTAAFSPWPIFFVGMTEGNEFDVALPDINGRVAIDINVRKDRLTETQYRVTAVVTVMLTSTMINDSFDHIRNEGQLESLIPYCITIYQVGTDDDEVLTTVQWDSSLNPLQSPGTGPNARVSQTVYELLYEGFI